MMKTLGTSLLAGAVAAGFSVGVALVLGASPRIAGTVTGVVTALWVGYTMRRERSQREEDRRTDSPRKG